MVLNNNKRTKKNLLMAEDFLSNIRYRIKEVVDVSNIDCVDVNSFLPANDKVDTYQHILLYLEIISQHIENITVESQKLHDDNIRLTESFKAVQNRNKRLEEMVEKVRDDYIFLNNKFEVTKKNLCKKNEKLERVQKRCDRNQKLLEENLKLKEENNSLKLNLQNIEDDYEQEKASLEEAMKISDENLFLNNKIDVLNEENKELKEEVKKLQLDSFKTNELSSKNKSLVNLVQKMKQTIKQKSTELNNKNNELSALKEKVNNSIEKRYEEEIILKCNLLKTKNQTTCVKNKLSASFVTSLQEVFNKMEDIDNFIYNMLEKENKASSNFFRNKDVGLDKNKRMYNTHDLI